MVRRVLPLLLPLCAALAGCASRTERVDPTRSAETTVSFDARDIAAATDELVRSLLESPRVGGTPDATAPDPWGLTVLAPGCAVEDGKRVAPGIMLNRNGEEVSK